MFSKVSDQKPLGNWTVKQGQKLTCATVFNSKTNEYVSITDNKVKLLGLKISTWIQATALIAALWINPAIS